MHLHEPELVRVICLCHEIKQKHIYNQHKQVTNCHDKNVGRVLFFMICIVEQQKCHHHKGQDGNTGNHAITALHLAVDIEQFFPEKTAV